jgi:hypothetical protein
VSKPKCRIVVEKGDHRGTSKVTLVDPATGRTAPGGQVSNRDIQKRCELLQYQARAGGSDTDVVER